MQITINKIPFDVRPVEAPLREALLADPAVRRAGRRSVWAWDLAERKGRYLVPVTNQKGVPVPLGMVAFVAKAGSNGGLPQRAEGPSAKMVERILAAVGAKEWEQVMQAVARVVGVPQKTVPLEAFAALNDKASYQIGMVTEFQVVELANAGRNLSAFLFLPGLLSFVHLMDAPVEGAPAPGSIRPAFALPPSTQAALGLRRIAVAQRLGELQAELDGTKPADLPPEDPRRMAAAKLGAEWKALQLKANPKAA